MINSREKKYESKESHSEAWITTWVISVWWTNYSIWESCACWFWIISEVWCSNTCCLAMTEFDNETLSFQSKVEEILNLEFLSEKHPLVLGATGGIKTEVFFYPNKSQIEEIESCIDKYYANICIEKEGKTCFLKCEYFIVESGDYKKSASNDDSPITRTINPKSIVIKDNGWLDNVLVKNILKEILLNRKYNTFL